MARLPKDKRDKLILLGIGAIAIIIGLWLGVIVTRRQQIDQSKSKLTKAMDKLDKARGVVSRAAQAESDMEAATQKLKAIEDTMVSGDLFSWALQLLERARVGHDVNIIDTTRPQKEMSACWPSSRMRPRCSPCAETLTTTMWESF